MDWFRPLGTGSVRIPLAVLLLARDAYAYTTAPSSFWDLDRRHVPARTGGFLFVAQRRSAGKH